MRLMFMAGASLVAAALAPGPGAAQIPATPQRGELVRQTYVELEAAAGRGAVALWALGAIEEHGPHLPLSTDIDIPSAQLAGAAQRLAEAGVETLTLPPYAWGVNHVTSAFPGSINIRPEIMTELMLDVFRSLRAAGFAEVYCITGHFDAAHGRAIAEAVRRADEEGIIRAIFVVPDPLARRLQLTAASPGVAIAAWPSADPGFADLHAGNAETSAMMHVTPTSVDHELAATLAPTDLAPEAVQRWRAGGEVARTITPHGYLGAPAGASAERGRIQIEQTSGAYADAILAHLQASRRQGGAAGR